MMTLQRKNRLKRIIEESRGRLLKTHPYYAILLMYLKYIAVADMKKISVNGRCVFFSPAFLEKLRWYETDYVLCHVLLHILNGDIYRGKEFCGDDFHLACDLFINRELLWDKGFDEHSEYPHLGSLSCYIPGSYADIERLTPYEAVEKFPFSLYCMSERGRSRMLPDSDLFWNIGEEKVGGELILDVPEIYARLFKGYTLRAAWEAAAGSAAKAVGTGPQITRNESEHMKRIIQKLSEPSLDWKRVLNEFIREQISDYSFSPPDRRFSETDFFLPDFNEKNMMSKDILFLVDTSGSVDDERLAAVYSEIMGAVEQFEGRLPARLGFFDVEVYGPVPFGSVGELLDIVPVGCGGTDFFEIFHWLQIHYANDLPSSLIIFTDGFAPYPDESEAMGVPVLWMIDNEEITPPWGKVTRVLPHRVSEV